MAQHTQERPIVPTESVVDTILHGNNNFVSTLDHLPCDLIRCLWVVQMMNLRNTRHQHTLTQLLRQTIPDTVEIERLNRIILRNATEAEYESKYAVSILNNHANILRDDLDILALLKSKLPGWTSEAVETRWKEWGVFKKNFIENTKATETPNIFDTYLINNEIKTPTQPTELKETINKPVSAPHNHTPSNGNGGLKIKLNLKSPNIESHNSPTPIKRKSPSAKPHGKENTNNNSHKKVKKNPTLKQIPVVPEPAEPPIEEVSVTLDTKPEEEAEEHYCFCNGPSFGKMVACENDKCPHEWFHFKCVGLTTEPTGNWFCSPKCEEQYVLKLKRKKKRKNW